MTVESYRVCDICGKRLVSGASVEELNYRIEPRNKIRMKVLGYMWSDPHSSWWSDGVDMCTDCWKDMKEWIKENRK